ncbi:hypothetical protein [Kribbella sandramycini]|uniref:Uncharacterized protein n=1 Tax=Kribbella sandramycini TaxID=60450 RepID=A0A841SJE0_9ACTN|nr:hypothetical protein [Kribbella sandramycini]MBB6569455.1 hypothetical protein [Kribbella sandramycini]
MVLIAPRPFFLVRYYDPSGVSGTGVVGEGTEWSDGSASLRWRGHEPVVGFWSGGVQSIERIHGHDGATIVVFPDELPANRTVEDFVYPLSSGQPVPAPSVGGLCAACKGAYPCTRCTDGMAGMLP